MRSNAPISTLWQYNSSHFCTLADWQEGSPVPRGWAQKDCGRGWEEVMGTDRRCQEAASCHVSERCSCWEARAIAIPTTSKGSWHQSQSAISWFHAGQLEGAKVRKLCNSPKKRITGLQITVWCAMKPAAANSPWHLWKCIWIFPCGVLQRSNGLLKLLLLWDITVKLILHLSGQSNSNYAAVSNRVPVLLGVPINIMRCRMRRLQQRRRGLQHKQRPKNSAACKTSS